jgi:heterodisulfide reductase subunit D
MVAGQPLFVTFFMVGAVIFLVGLALRISLYWRGRWDFGSLLKGAVATLFSAKIVKLIEIVFLDGILQRRLFNQDKSRWLMKVLIMVGYPGILIAGHLKVEVMPQFEQFPHLVRFFYAPFCDFYYFRDVVVPSLAFQDALFGILFDLFGAMILMGEFIAIFRRFVAKAVPFKTSLGDIVAVNLLGGWFILRFFCEATSILTYSLPASIAQYWFVAFGLSKLIAPLGLPWSSLNYPLWSVSGLFLATLVAFIPFNKKLWHIITIPLVMFINLMPKEAFRPGAREASLPLSVKELIALDSCVKCGSCVDVCPVYVQNQQLETTMGGVYSNLKSFIRRGYGFLDMVLGSSRANREFPKEYSDQAYLCTLCGRCKVVCPAFIDTKDVRIAARCFVVDRGTTPEMMGRLAENLSTDRNISGEPVEERPMWVEDLRQAPKDMYQKDRAKIVYFVGCVASYFPMAQKIPQSFVQILDQAGVDFTILGEEEWCCGFPLIGAGMVEKAKELMEHNLQKVAEVGAESVVFACPSCYHTWKERYRAHVSLFHATEFLEKLINEGKIKFKELNVTVTYHDPCDLGRSSDVYEEPRRILRSIPGLKLVELEHNREDCTCCGGGGNLEMVDPKLATAIAKSKIEEIQRTGAEMVVTACQQCVRTMATYARRNKVPIEVIDITMLVHRALKREDSVDG